MFARASIAPLRTAGRRSVIQQRNASTANAPADSKHLPFNIPHGGREKAFFGAKLFGIMGFGFFIPFGATIYQLTKAK